ncbi:DUF2634 domain-containing protein [Jeotgalibacillus terrae]|uniref:DUF2634 domain-containing protein n=1 Tax=Jeotgalibacillus terrae TaxID=587735 RepID=A0ABW5ZEE6_9BACL|nr:DUF2634 domain-containing protein [Jeotgalibacillus terrae]MBM7577662.1 hypothetical protein [Jeotgalibacillus terrae]
MLPKITELVFNETITQTEQPVVPGKSFLFDFETGEFVFSNGKMIEITGKEALKQWIHKTILTARQRFVVYMDNPDHGIRAEDLIGTNYPADFINKSMENELKGALLVNQEINSLTNFSAVKSEGKLSVSFTVNSIYDTFPEEVTISG